MHLQVAADVGELHEVGQLALFGGFDLAGHFAEFRLDVGELQLGVNFLFGFAGDRPCRLSASSARIRSESSPCRWRGRAARRCVPCEPVK